MKFMSTRLIARDVKMVVSFYELVLQVKATWLAPVFAEIATPVATVAVGSVETVALFKAGSAEPGANRTAILEFLVDNVEQEYERLKDKVDIVHEPRMLPWGNMAAQFRDPEGTLVSLFTPVTEEARKRFQIR
ncbi:glyoxalase [Erwinia typographi]|uniref:Glyoxalase n=1 Tax=Erwinia typographi TaxID=371042 RepID=A0A0A3Z9C8_9GAMM|nr:VOC family protein [Erwinia typographi]KGT95460.1 glyoxalase [Erwinia typographi]